MHNHTERNTPFANVGCSGNFTHFSSISVCTIYENNPKTNQPTNPPFEQNPTNGLGGGVWFGEYDFTLYGEQSNQTFDTYTFLHNHTRIPLNTIIVQTELVASKLSRPPERPTGNMTRYTKCVYNKQCIHIYITNIYIKC